MERADAKRERQCRGCGCGQSSAAVRSGQALLVSLARGLNHSRQQIESRETTVCLPAAVMRISGSFVRTLDVMLQAATQVLEGGGEDSLTTKTVAERAGVSIGTLYQY